jgi:hypothetical protein
MANEVIARAFRSVDIPAELEPSGLSRTDGKRPDGVTMIPYSRGLCAVWDFTCPDTLAPSHISSSSSEGGSVAQTAEHLKRQKYSNLESSYQFHPVAIETLGAMGPGALALTCDLGKRAQLKSGDRREIEFLRQRLSLAVVRGNASAVRGTITKQSDEYYTN